METTISNFHTSFYTQEIQKFAFQIPHVQILGTNHCGDSRRIVFKCRKYFEDVLCRCDYSQKVVASFSHKIQSEYCSVNISVSIKGISLENFSATPQTGIKASTKSFPCHAVFHYFLQDDNKQDSATTTTHRKSLIEI